MSRKHVLLAAAGLAVLALAALPTLFYPLTRDQGAYAYIADLMMHGGAPYRDVWDLKPPAVYLAYQAAFMLFGRSETSVRVLDALYTLLSAALVAALTLEVFENRHLAALAGWIYALSYFVGVHFYSVASPESFAVPLLAATAWGAVRGLRSDAKAAWLVAGIAAGVAFWFKPTTAIVTLTLFAWSGWRLWSRDRDANEPLRALRLVVAGCLLGMLPIGWYLQGSGLREMLYLWRTYGTDSYVSAPGLVQGPLALLDVLRQYVGEWQLLVWLSLAGALGALARRQAQVGIGALLAFLVSGVAAALLQGKLFEYHWIPVLAPGAALSAAALFWLAEEVQPTSSRVGWRQTRTLFAAIVIAGAVAGAAYDKLVVYRRLATYLSGRIGRGQFYAQFDIGRDFSHTGALEAADYLRERTGAEDAVLIWGAEPLVNFLAQRRSPTKYVFSYMLFDGDGGERWHEDFLEELRRTAPAYIVLVDNDVSPLTPQGSRALLERFPAFVELLQRDYQSETQIEDYLFFRRKQGVLAEAEV